MSTQALQSTLIFIEIYIHDSLINETLYKADSTKSHRMMREDPKIYQEVCLFFLFVRPY